jgi:hypothetical protein
MEQYSTNPTRLSNDILETDIEKFNELYGYGIQLPKKHKKGE